MKATMQSQPNCTMDSHVSLDSDLSQPKGKSMTGARTCPTGANMSESTTSATMPTQT